jgi:hypothetical protein
MPKGPRPRPAIERVLARITVTESGCWEFQGAKSRGYGVVGAGLDENGRHRNKQTHVVVYEHFVGPVPEGAELDHLCRNPPCCNWQHLEAVTHAVNMERAEWHRTEVCPQGHPYDEVNTYWYPDRKRKDCRACRREQSLAWYYRKKANGRAS